jgi:hypothetical protein
MNRRMSMLACGAVIAVMLGVAPANAQFLYSGASFGPILASLNPANGATISSVTVSAAGMAFSDFVPVELMSFSVE